MPVSRDQKVTDVNHGRNFDSELRSDARLHYLYTRATPLRYILAQRLFVIYSRDASPLYTHITPLRYILARRLSVVYSHNASPLQCTDSTHYTTKLLRSQHHTQLWSRAKARSPQAKPGWLFMILASESDGVTPAGVAQLGAVTTPTVRKGVCLCVRPVHLHLKRQLAAPPLRERVAVRAAVA